MAGYRLTVPRQYSASERCFPRSAHDANGGRDSGKQNWKPATYFGKNADNRSDPNRRLRSCGRTCLSPSLTTDVAFRRPLAAWEMVWTPALLQEDTEMKGKSGKSGVEDEDPLPIRHQCARVEMCSNHHWLVRWSWRLLLLVRLRLAFPLRAGRQRRYWPSLKSCRSKIGVPAFHQQVDPHRTLSCNKRSRRSRLGRECSRSILAMQQTCVSTEARACEGRFAREFLCCNGSACGSHFCDHSCHRVQQSRHER